MNWAPLMLRDATVSGSCKSDRWRNSRREDKLTWANSPEAGEAACLRTSWQFLVFVEQIALEQLPAIWMNKRRGAFPLSKMIWNKMIWTLKNHRWEFILIKKLLIYIIDQISAYIFIDRNANENFAMI